MQESEIINIKVFFIILLLFFNLILISGFISTPALATQPAITITMVKAYDEIDILEDQTVTLNGFVHCDTKGFGQNVQKIIVRLEGEVDLDDWGVSINPMTIVFEPFSPEEVDIQVYVTAPNQESASQSCSITIAGTAEVEPGVGSYDLEPAYGTVVVKEFMKCLCSGKFEKTANAGDQTEFDVMIMNYGNHDAQFIISIGDGFGGAVSDWEIIFKPTSFIIEEKSEMKIKIDLNIPDSANKGTYSIPVSVETTSDNNDQTTEVANFELYITIEYEILGMGFGSFILFIILIVIILAVFVWKRKKILGLVKSNNKKNEEK